MKQREKEKQREMLVVKSDDLVKSARCELTSVESDFIDFVISKIKPTDKVFQKYEISIDEYCEICGVDRNHFYTDAKKMLSELDKKSVWIKKNDKIFIFRWFQYAEISEKGVMSVMLHNEMSEHLLGLDKYNAMPFYSKLYLKSKHSKRLYEWLKSYLYAREKEIDVEDLKFILTAEGYKNFNMFRQRVLDKAVKEINEYSDIEVIYTEEKSGRKVSTIHFDLREKDAWEKMIAYTKAEEMLEKKGKSIEVKESTL